MISCGCKSGLDKAIAAAKAATKATDTVAKNHLDIELLYIDLSVCDRCQSTEQNLDEALTSMVSTLKNSGYIVTLSKTLIESEDQARELEFVTSPTIRINGQDIQFEVQESHCSSCSSLVDNEPVDCRSWAYNGEHYDAPPTAMIIEAISRHLSSDAASEFEEQTEPYRLPENLKRFFTARRGAVSERISRGSCITSCDY